jgi:hypothetical protein
MDDQDLEGGTKSKRLYEKIKHKNYSKKVDLTPRGCTRFNENHRENGVSNAMIYLKLRNEKCKRQESLTFAGKTYCRVDSTKQVFGPPGKPLLHTTGPTPKITHNVSMI